MHKDPFVVLGVNKDATQAEIQEAYETLREAYRAEIHSEGEAGKSAAKKLSEVEDAYREAMEIRAKGSEVKGVYTHISDLLKAKNIEAAQSALDNVSERDAEWHYYQSAVYHAKGWSYEAKAQLEMAINMDPDNDKYKETLERMKKHESTDDSTSTASGSTQQRSYDTYDNYSRRSSAGDCCAGLICADCCCECMGGDLIRCC